MKNRLFPLACVLALAAGPALNAQSNTATAKLQWKKSGTSTTFLTQIPFFGPFFNAAQAEESEAPISYGKNFNYQKSPAQKPTARCTGPWKKVGQRFVIIKRSVTTSPKCKCAKTGSKTCCCEDACKCEKNCKCGNACKATQVKSRTKACGVTRCPVQAPTYPQFPRYARVATPALPAQQYAVELKIATRNGSKQNVFCPSLVTSFGRPAIVQVGDTKIEVKVRPLTPNVYRQPRPAHHLFVPTQPVVHPMVPPTAVFPQPIGIRPRPPISVGVCPVPCPVPCTEPCCPVAVQKCPCNGAAKFFEMISEMIKTTRELRILEEVLEKKTAPKCNSACLPSPNYVDHPPQYFPPCPSYPFEKELAAMEAAPTKCEEECSIQYVDRSKQVDAELEEAYHWQDKVTKKSTTLSRVLLQKCGPIKMSVSSKRVLVEGKDLSCYAETMSVADNGDWVLQGNVKLKTGSLMLTAKRASISRDENGEVEISVESVNVAK